MYQNLRGKKDKETRKNFIYAGVSGFLPFLVLAIVGFADWTSITAQDYKIGAFFYNLRAPLRTTIATVITHLGDTITQVVITVVIVLLFFIFKKVKTGLWFGITMLLGPGILNHVIKEIIGRVRPDQIEHLVVQGGYSFPSGHSMSSMVLFGSLIFLLFRSVRSNSLKWLLSILLGFFPLLIGLSRIYLGVHYPSDVLGGFSLGFAWLCFSIAIYGIKCTHDEFQLQKPYTLRI